MLKNKNTRIVLTVLFLVTFIVAAVFATRHNTEVITPLPPEPTTSEQVMSIEQIRTRVIGQSVEGRPLTVIEFGTGAIHILFVGGIHGGYEWNSVLLAHKAIDYLTEHHRELPKSVTVSIIPSLNPDGVYAVTQKEGLFTPTDILFENQTLGTGRFNARNVDLNRNFNCKWQPTSTWRGNVVDAGDYPFSEPEAFALRTYIDEIKPVGVVFWHSQSNAVYASECEEGILPGTHEMMYAYGTAANYKTIDTFDAYPVTGDAEGWLASIGIPAITVELATHETIEWEQNLRGMQSTISLFGK